MASDFNPGNIISDQLFYDSQALDANGVQSFLNRQVPNCRAGYTCLKDYRQNTDNRAADRYCNGYTGRSSESAAQIIDNVARSCGISQKVLLVLLQKEQSLVTSTWPEAGQYSAATGQGCPDTAPCDKATAGFFYQVYYAARQYEIYRLTASSWGYQAGRWNNILYHPDSSRRCGSARVYIENQATAGLYIYTPYTPNTAALNNLYGTGDNCSAYGNRNFWRLYTDWFGSTQTPAVNQSPFGSLDIVRGAPGGVQVSGWAVDPETSSSIEVHTYVNGVGVAVRAEGNRPDVGAAYPQLGSQHGFDLRIPVPASGSYEVCSFAINVGVGGNTLLGCRTVTALVGSPVGSIDRIEGIDGGISLQGWAFDPDSPDPIEVHAYVDDAGTPFVANGARPDVAAAYPGWGGQHGFDTVLPASRGAHQLCLFAINVKSGETLNMTCEEVVVPGIPFGSLDTVTVQGGKVRVDGWAIDPDITTPIEVHVYVRGEGSAHIASVSRPDVARAYPGSGANHGFSATVAAPVGKSDVCAFAINDAAGGHTLLGCRSITVTDAAPIGSIDVVSATPGTINVAGWALDRDTGKEPTAVHIYVDGVGIAKVADLSRMDVAAAYPAGGDRHGFSTSIPSQSGRKSVCVWAINEKSSGANTLLGCRDAIVP
ncbi:hypothetical protein [Microbacterium sp. P05]|uniref:hypothetical protein n=1 Tax=Microbacterium sp. P05 TaxID=3366948 RepID=UPI0037472230